MTENHQEFTESHLRLAAGANSANLAILADLATRSWISFFWSLAAKVSQLPLELGRISKNHDLDNFLHYTNWQFAEHAKEVPGALKGCTLRHLPTIFSRPEAARTVQPLIARKSRAEGYRKILTMSVFSEVRGGNLVIVLVRLCERLAVRVSAEQIAWVVGCSNGTSRNLYEDLGFLERARQEYSFQDRIKAGIGFSRLKTAHGENL